jgi:hypothetical protein
LDEIPYRTAGGDGLVSLTKHGTLGATIAVRIHKTTVAEGD